MCILNEGGLHKTYRTSVDTQGAILQHSVNLFNENGSGATSINQIAEACSISPGNLYYHFKNKEALIRAILEQMHRDWNGLYEDSDPETFNLGALRQFLRGIFDLTWKYRFFYRELPLLMQHDELLKQRYDEIRQGRLAQQSAFLELALGPIQPEDNQDNGDLANALRIAWILGDTWILHLEMIGQPVNEETTLQGAELILHVLKPFFPTD
jgi:AcrR family transcriptional regulator